MAVTLSFGDNHFEDVLLVVVQAYEVEKRAHSHTFNELMIISAGEIVHIINGEKEILHQGEARLVYAHDCHKIETPVNGEIINISMSHKVFENIKDTIGADKSGKWITDYLNTKAAIPSNKIKNILSEIKDFPLYEFSSVYYRTKVKGILLDLFPYFINRQATEGGTYQKMPLWLSDICKAYETKEALVEGLNAAYRISKKTPEHVSRVFKNFFSMTPTQYINSKRITFCKNMLISTNMPIIDICYEIGYESLSVFYSKFKENTGVTPAVFRRKYKSLFG